MSLSKEVSEYGQCRGVSPRPTDLAMSTGPSLRLIPATPVDPKLTTPGDPVDDPRMIPKLTTLTSLSDPTSPLQSDLTSELGISNSTKTTSILTNASMSRTSSAKSRRSSKSSIKAERKSSKSSRSFGNLSKYSLKTLGSDKELENRSDNSPNKSSGKRSIRLMKKKSMKRENEDELLHEANSEGNLRKLSAKNSFYKVLDKIRGVTRRNSAVSDQATDQSGGVTSSGGGQAEFLASMTRMSDSRIVENWLLSIEDEQLSEPPPLETLTLPESRTDQKTPTNEEIDTTKKATVKIDEGRKHMFELSSDDSSLGDGDVFHDPQEAIDRRRSMFKPTSYGRQVSESSEYTTDTHDTGEIAHVTAMNTLRNTANIFTSVGDELKKVNMSPGSNYSSSVFRPIASNTDMESLRRPSYNDMESCRSTETLRTTISSVRQTRAASENSSDIQGTPVLSMTHSTQAALQ